jgi:hypothetical protein
MDGVELMATPTQTNIEMALRQVRDQESFIQRLLIEGLDWPVPEQIRDIEDMAYLWTAAELRAPGLEHLLRGGQVWQLQPLQNNAVWGVLLVEFPREDIFTTGRGLTGPLRQVLRGLVPSRRRQPHLQVWDRSHLLFICTHQYRHFRVAYFKAPPEKEKTALLATFGWGPGIPARTACEFNLPALGWPDDPTQAEAWVSKWAGAFDVEKVTREFFKDYRAVFEQVEHALKGVSGDENRRLVTQRLFNRLMFLYFIQKKGWLSFGGDKNYLRALFTAAEVASENFLNDRLFWAFFHGLNTAGENPEIHSAAQLRQKRGEVPFLNGGLFDLEDEYDIQDKVSLPNKAFAGILDRGQQTNNVRKPMSPFNESLKLRRKNSRTCTELSCG